METERKLESQVPSSEAVPPVYSTQAVTQPVERTRNKAVPRPKACNHPVTGCRRLTSENRLTPFCRTRHGKQLQPFGPSNGLFFKKLGLTFMIHRYCCDSAQRIPHTHDIVVTHNHDFLDGWYLQNVTDSKTNSVRDLIQELKKRTVHFHGNEPVKNDQWNGMVQQRTVDSLFRKLFVSCDKQSRTGDLVLQIPYFVNGEIVNVGTWTLKRATTAEEKLILMEAKQLESVTSAYQLVDKVDSLEDRLSSAHVSINEPYQAVARAVRKETNTPTNRFAVPSYKFEVISNPKKVDTHAHSPIRSCIPSKTPVNSRSVSPFGCSRPASPLVHQQQKSTLPSFSKTDFLPPLCADHANVHSDSDLDSDSDSDLDSDTDIEISWSSKRPGEETTSNATTQHKSSSNLGSILDSISATIGAMDAQDKHNKDEKDDLDSESETDDTNSSESESAPDVIQMKVKEELTKILGPGVIFGCDKQSKRDSTITTAQSCKHGPSVPAVESKHTEGNNNQQRLEDIKQKLDAAKSVFLEINGIRRRRKEQEQRTKPSTPTIDITINHGNGSRTD